MLPKKTTKARKAGSEAKGLKVFYVRLSADKRRKPGAEKMAEEVEYASQLAELRRLWPGEPDQIVCEKKSGSDPFKLLLDLITNLPEHSIIYGVTIDRLTRLGPFALGYIVEAAKERNVTLHVTDDGALNTLEPMEQMMATMKAFSASLEAQAISRRMIQKIKDRKEKGLKWGFEIARERGTWKHGAKARNPLWEIALPRLRELKAKGHTIREISKIASREHDELISPATVCRLLKADKAKPEKVG
ncbi:MAG TPA: recombinase family protein [Oligoflexus sp.]|uniref:recombinase family protein n=1 Tax=Oligoflexus sp. TaxID=1971216 RepID=UPI002D31C7D1|nr:recombinase family protein [Oligoflexus sp.]HYX39959.1 recombinase family protein [Oligoflexus sp.]